MDMEYRIACRIAGLPVLLSLTDEQKRTVIESARAQAREQVWREQEAVRRVRAL